MISTSTSPGLGPSRSMVSMVSGLLASQATAARVFMAGPRSLGSNRRLVAQAPRRGSGSDEADGTRVRGHLRRGDAGQRQLVAGRIRDDKAGTAVDGVGKHGGEILRLAHRLADIAEHRFVELQRVAHAETGDGV